MSSKVDAAPKVSETHVFPQTNLRVLGLASNYPEHSLTPQALKDIAHRHYPRTAAMDKVLNIGEKTGIDARSVAVPLDHPILDGERLATVDELSQFFLVEGVKIAVGASRKAIKEWGGDVSEITHLVATTCTNSANPGYDYYVANELGLGETVERALLHGVGCAGGLTALRTAANIALGASFLGKPARVLVVACELSSLMARSELESLHETQELRIGVTIFGDGASAIVLSNGIGETPEEKPLFDLVAWDYRTLPDSAGDIGFDVHPNGWKVILTPRVPTLASSSTAPLLEALLPRVPEYKDLAVMPAAAEFDWVLHPGGTKVLTGVEKMLGITPHHLRASYDVYKHHGNSSSATIFSVMNRLRKPDMGKGKEKVMCCAFGPGVAVEMCLLKRYDLGEDVEEPATPTAA